MRRIRKVEVARRMMRVEPKSPRLGVRYDLAWQYRICRKGGFEFREYMHSLTRGDLNRIRRAIDEALNH